jgi:hypothetical protein
MTQVFQAQLQEQPLASYVWDLNDPGAPESTLVPSSQITALNFNLKVQTVAAAIGAVQMSHRRRSPRGNMHGIRLLCLALPSCICASF